MWNQGETKDNHEQHNGPAPPGEPGPAGERGRRGAAGFAEKEGDGFEESVASPGVQLGFRSRPATPGLFSMRVECASPDIATTSM